MRIDNYMDDTFIERRYFSEIRLMDPKDLYDSIVFMNVFLFQNGVPCKAQTWTCRPNPNNIGWTIMVEYTFMYERW